MALGKVVKWLSACQMVLIEVNRVLYIVDFLLTYLGGVLKD